MAEHPHAGEWRRRAPSLAEQTEGLGLFDAPPPVERPSLTPDENHRLDSHLQAVLTLMRDGKPHTIREIRAVGGSSGDRRVRELRALGYRIDVKRTSEPGVFHYTLLGGTRG